jgi:DNA-binding NarL/FixJ family response regulator
VTTQETKSSIRVMIVDDQCLIRKLISSILASAPGIEVVGTSDDGAEAIQLVEQLDPDVVLMDIVMPGMDGFEATNAISAKSDCKILFLSTCNEPHYLVRALQAGASGYFVKDGDSADLIKAIRMTSEGVFHMTHEVAMGLNEAAIGEMKESLAPHKPKANIPLSRRELDVLRLLGEGMSNAEIAEALFISSDTVKKHLTKILRTLNLRDRTQAALFADEHDLSCT